MRNYYLDVATQPGTIVFLPGNFSLDIYGYIASNTGSLADTIYVNEVQFDSNGTITGTVKQFPITVPGNDSKANFNETVPQFIIPPSGYVTAYSTQGSTHLTIKADPVYRQV